MVFDTKTSNVRSATPEGMLDLPFRTVKCTHQIKESPFESEGIKILCEVLY